MFETQIVLIRRGHVVTTHTGVDGSLELVRDGKYDLLVTDYLWLVGAAKDLCPNSKRLTITGAFANTIKAVDDLADAAERVLRPAA